MRQQIDSDLADFSKTTITETMIEETFQEISNVQGGHIASLARVRFKDGIIEVKHQETLSQIEKYRLQIFLAALKLLQEAVELPDLDFLVSLADHYDRPLFLRVTKVPVFTACKAKANHRSILFPNGLFDPERAEVFKKVKAAALMQDWKRREEIAFWRGSLSEGFYPHFDWDFKPRPLLMFFSKHHPDLVDAGTIENVYFEAMGYTWKMWMKENYFLREYVPAATQVMFRYLIAIDSTCAPISLQWQLFSGSTVLKAESTLLQWFYQDLIPYVHYVPFRTDSADLGEKVVWLKEHPEEALKIAKNAQVFAEERLTDEAIFHYTYCMLKTYADLLK
ncbi:MAG: glycosyl transferase family 90 [Chlamydiota bacterium]